MERETGGPNEYMSWKEGRADKMRGRRNKG